jgi:hypothetical protein
MLLRCLIRSRKTMHLGKTLRFKKIASDAWHVGAGSAIIEGVCCGSMTAVADRPMARPVYPQLRKYPCVPALALRAKARAKSPSRN